MRLIGESDMTARYSIATEIMFVKTSLNNTYGKDVKFTKLTTNPTTKQPRDAPSSFTNRFIVLSYALLALTMSVATE